MLATSVSILLRVAYDGTDFHGWARQAARPDGAPVRTAQAELEHALGRLSGRAVEVRGASRTDAGVHALGQVAAFERCTPIPCANLVRALGDALPRDLAVTDAWEESGPEGAAIEPRFANLGKRYAYRVRTASLRDPFAARQMWQLGSPLDAAAMHAAGQRLVGTHDFAAFRAAGCQARSTTRTITAVRVRAEPDGVAIDVEGLAFLHNMVRIIAGTLVEVGLGRRDPATIDAVLERPERRGAGPTAPPEGLTLVEVRWPGRELPA